MRRKETGEGKELEGGKNLNTEKKEICLVEKSQNQKKVKPKQKVQSERIGEKTKSYDEKATGAVKDAEIGRIMRTGSVGER